jgi:hypothetical protein
MHGTRLSRHPRRHPRRLVAGLALALCVTAFGGATVADAQTARRGVVAANSLGTATSTFTGATRDGRAVTGRFVPDRFTLKDGRIRAVGTLKGVIEGKAGVSRAKHFSKVVSDRVTRIDGLSWRNALAGRDAMRTRAAATCDVLNLVLGPLDLDLLGLQVHLKRVVLDIVAVSGAGNLLGNLVCAVAGLLDGGLAGLLTQVRSLLNLILGALDLGPLPVG